MKEQIIEYLQESCLWQDSVLWFDSIDSTNTFAKHLAMEGAPHGTVVIADHQTAGRGRRGRSFLSSAGTGIYMSIILRPKCPPAQLMHLTCATAVAMCDAVERCTSIRPRIKWTNDLVVGERKLAGILTELGMTHNGLVDYAIVGIGINCCQQTSEFPEDIRSIACSLSSVTGKDICRAKIAAAMMDALFLMDQQLLTSRSEILRQYRENCITLGKHVSIVKADGSVTHAKALDIDEEGALIAAFPNGETQIINSGEVSVRGMYGYV
jgi:BirA family biotin operon repressor/biotin-[acetyl-CoA-carboxylase] ligase